MDMVQSEPPSAAADGFTPLHDEVTVMDNSLEIESEVSCHWMVEV